MKRQIPLKKTWDEYGRAGFAISLAREHFEAAARAGVTARPLNLYYGALNFFKALGQLFAVRPTAVDWNRHGLQSIFDSPNVMMACAAIKPNGVFKLGYTSVPRAHFQIFGDIVDYAWTDDNAVSVEGASFSRLTNHEITLRDVFSRIPELGLHYFRALQARPRVMRGYVEYDNRGNDQFLVTYHVPLQTQGALRPDRKYANSLLNPANLGFTGPSDHFDEMVYSRQPMKPDGSELPMLYSSLEGDTFFVQSINGDHLPELFLHYIGLFILSNAVRYQPDIWLRLTNRRPAALGVIERFMDVTSIKFPAMILNTLSATHFLFVPSVEGPVR